MMPRRLFVLFLCLCPHAGAALADGGVPARLDELLAAKPSREAAAGFADDKRRAAMRTAALGFAARAGLARRGWEIRRLLDRFEAELSSVYRFRELMLHDGGFTVMPPVLAETRRAFRLARDGARAVSARRVLRILEPERIVGAAPDWRDFLVRSWPAPEAPAAVLFPRDAGETALWRGWLREGWARGTALADDVFAADLDRLTQVFEGTVLWRRAHLAGTVTAPTLETNRAIVAGDGRLMRIDETSARLGPHARFDLRPGAWRVLPLGEMP